jgi:hypothetical protein
MSYFFTYKKLIENDKETNETNSSDKIVMYNSKLPQQQQQQYITDAETLTVSTLNTNLD